MSQVLSKRRMAENEMVFREYNEQIQKGFDYLKQIAKEDKQEDLIKDDDAPLQFFCECSDENCRKRVKMRPSRYNQIHKNRDYFVVICGHEFKDIEQVIEKEPGFCIVKKFIKMPKFAQGLNATDADNT